jgi:F420-0:gamma-glutamyl ligase
MTIIPIKTKIFRESENLLRFVTLYIKRIPERSVLVVTSKIVALSEGRTAVITSTRTKPPLIRKESEMALRTKYVWLTVKDGMMMASAGIDESNANGKLILLPRDSFKTAHLLRNELRRHYRVQHLGVLITDSRTVPLRLGVTGVALGYAGFRGIRDYHGTPDIFGRKFKFSRTNVADSLATAAALVMGEGAERQPLALTEKAPVEFSEKVNRKELRIDIREDMYLPLFARLFKTRGGKKR